MKIKLFYSKDFKGHWPVGVAAIVVACDEEAARSLLEVKLKELGLTGRQSNGDPVALREVDLKTEQAIVLLDGNY